MRPAVFQDLPLTTARERARGRLLLIDFTASWCGPCKQMDQVTWVDPKVVAWLNEKAVALQLDVDADAITKEFDIRAMPTLIAIKDDRELDRIVGYRAPGALLAWLEGLEQGKTELDAIRAEAKSGELGSRFQLAQALLMRGALDEALGELLWLWRHALERDPSWAGVRQSFLLGAMQEAAAASPKAQDALRALREQAPRGGDDWVCLNHALGEADATLAWVDEQKAKGPLPRLHHYVETLLMERGRWKDLGEALHEPVKRLEQTFAQLGALPPELAAEAQQGVRAETEALEKALRAAGRAAEADELVALARRLDAPR